RRPSNRPPRLDRPTPPPHQRAQPLPPRLSGRRRSNRAWRLGPETPAKGGRGTDLRGRRSWRQSNPARGRDKARAAWTKPPPFAISPPSQESGSGAQGAPLAISCVQNSSGGRVLVQIFVRDNNVDQALKALKKKMQREGTFREMKRRNHYEKPSEKRAREQAEAVRRARKLARKRAQREGLLPKPPPKPR